MFPDLDTFRSMADQYDAVPITRRLLSDSLTPVSAFQRIDNGKTACLFESVVGGERVGRYSFLAVEPQLEVSSFANDVTICQPGAENESYTCDNPLEEIRRRLNQFNVAKFEDMPPFTGGAVGYAGYDAVRYVEHLPNAPEDDRGLADMSFAFYDRMLVFDHITKTITIVALAWTKRHDSLEEAYADAERRIESMIESLNQPDDGLICADAIQPIGDVPSFESNFSQEEFESAVNDCIEYIKAGDIFQVVLSQRLQLKISCDPFEIYRSLRVLNPSPFMFFLRSGATTLVGSSPEIMCRVVDNEMTVRPLAGTRPRGKTPDEDLRLEKELLADEKEQAEHVMLVDLGRNDVGRVAAYGSIAIPDCMVVERYSHVMHISSTVTGQLNESSDSFDALMASLPAGTVSGAPKVRAMEIIDEFEPHRRGPYAGAVGYIDYSNNMDTCIALRTMVIKDGIAYVQAGAGIVADSDPTSEYEETLNKAKGLLRAIQMTHQRVEDNSHA
ncbi:MAG: anthranilate synthase component I [Planctomycetota bacterium]